MSRPRPRPGRAATSSLGSAFVTAAVVGSLVVHGGAYALLSRLRRPAVKPPPPELTVQLPPPRRVFPVRVRSQPPKPEVTPRPTARTPVPQGPRPAVRRATRRPRRSVKPLAPALKPAPKATPPAMLDLRSVATAGVDARLTNQGGGEAFVVGTTAQGIPQGQPDREPKPKGTALGNAPPSPGSGGRPAATVVLKQLPEVVTVPQVSYPAEARRKRVQGTVKLQITIDRRGRVVKVRILRSLGHGLDQAAVRALWRARFRPAVGSDGRPMSYSIRYRYRFRLEG